MASSIEYLNPIIPGFAPDPSVVFVEDTFYLVNSSFHVFPGLPIYASKDLQLWNQIGNAINRAEQLSLTNANTDEFSLGPNAMLYAVQGLLAPSIRYHNGIFYVICTNSTSDGTDLNTDSFYVTTTDIWSDKWSDLIHFSFKGIDPSLFFDDDGRAYIQGSWRAGNVWDPQCSIRQFEVDIATGEPLSETKELWKGIKGSDAEGPHVYKKDGWYYLLTAEGGTFEHHMITMARSKNIWGPYESFEMNPVLTAFGTEGLIQNTGHGDLFQDGNGQWWAVALGVRNDGGRYPLGRETFLTSVSWPTEGWPAFELPKMSFNRASPSQKAAIKTPLEISARVNDIFIRGQMANSYNFSENTITLVPSETTLSATTGTSTFLGKRQRSLDCIATATLLSSNNDNGTWKAGLAVYKDNFRHTEIYYDRSISKLCFSSVIGKKGAAKLNQDTSNSEPNFPISLKIRATSKMYEFSFQVGDEGEWRTLGMLDTMDITALDFTGPIFGIFASGTAADSERHVQFQDFEVV
ncbi:related to xylosidase/arabinosidase [Phialocephala subalpina]|uniref:Related to xylosidase/arabinosidase n=1 Tax=Phialocephala subalpina TaxID=576137 RepID=A0A1L7XWJ0_9HELO|nr:related to xylosidase/arabinosidase [Phialocephala subalpina]